MRQVAFSCIAMCYRMFEIRGKVNTAICYATLDEAPMACKSLEDIIEVIADSVDIIEVLKPIYNFKAN